MKFYQCDGCGCNRRRITVHNLDGTKMQFCSLQCVTDLAEDDGDFKYHVTAEDIADGA